MKTHYTEKGGTRRRFMALLLSFALLFGAIGIGMPGTLSEPDSITSTGYEGWQAGTLSGALSAIGEFLTAQAAGTAERPFRDNTVFSEGSLQALKTAYDAAQALDSNTTLTGQNLARLQLIRCVRSLEPKAVFLTGEPSKILLNNYPDSKTTPNGKYTIEMKYTPPGTPPSAEGYDVIFVLDWSASMNHSFTVAPPLGSIANPVYPNCARMIAKDIVLSLSQDLARDYPTSRVNIFGVNVDPTLTMDNVPNSVHFDEKTGFFSASECESVINSVFETEPSNSGDDIAQFTSEAIKELDRRDDTSRTPVIILLSDFQIYFYHTDKFVEQSNNYWINAMPAQADIFDQKYPQGILIAARFDHYGNRSFMSGINCSDSADSKMEQYYINRSHWDWLKITQNNFSNAQLLIKNMIYDSMPQPENFTVIDPMGDKYNYAGGWSGTLNTPVYTNAGDTLAYTDNAAFLSQYKITADGAKLSGVKPETKYPANAETTLNYDGQAPIIFHDLPTGFLPVTQMAVELYMLEGSLEERPFAENYTLEKVMAGENLALYEGQGEYTDTSEYFSSLPYGTVVGRELIWAMLSSSYADLLAGYRRQDTAGLTGESLKVVFDAGKNVYKVYAFKETAAQQCTVTHRFVELAREDNVLMDEFTRSVEYGGDYDLSSGIPASVITKNQKSYSYYGYRINDGEIITAGIPSPILSDVREDYTITFLYRTTYTIILKYHDESSPYTVLSEDRIITVRSGDSFLPSGTNPPERLIKDRYEYSYTGKYKRQSDLSPQVSDVVEITGISDDLTVIYTYQKGERIPDERLIVHIRQIVLDAKSSVPVPEKGYHYIYSSTADRVNLISNSAEAGGMVPYSDYTLPFNIDFYVIETIVPQFYEYTGHIVTTENSEHNPDNRQADVPVLDTMDHNEFWVTVYIRPEGRPNQYTWDIKSNDFGVIYNR